MVRRMVGWPDGRMDERTNRVLYIDARTHLRGVGFIVDIPTDGPTDGHSLL